MSAAHVSEKKKKELSEITKLLREYPIISITDMNNIPAPQLQKMRSLLRGKVLIRMTKKTLMKRAFEELKSEKKNIEKLADYLKGMPALILSKEDPFKLNKILEENVSFAPAKAGQVAPDDIVVHKGKTSFPPGPLISELSSVGIKAGIEDGKIAIKEDKVVVKKGEVVSPKVASVLSRLDIKPMRIGLEIIAAYDNGEIFTGEVLKISTEKTVGMLRRAFVETFNLAVEIGYLTKETVELLISKASLQAKTLALEAGILTKETVGEELSKAESQAKALSEVIKQ